MLTCLKAINKDLHTNNGSHMFIGFVLDFQKCVDLLKPTLILYKTTPAPSANPQERSLIFHQHGLRCQRWSHPSILRSGTKGSCQKFKKTPVWTWSKLAFDPPLPPLSLDRCFFWTDICPSLYPKKNANDPEFGLDPWRLPPSLDQVQTRIFFNFWPLPLLSQQ